MVAVDVSPPRFPGSRAGLHHFAVQVTSPHYPAEQSRQVTSLTITPYYDFSVGEVSPKRQSVSWSKTSAWFLISVTNRGNSNTLFRLARGDPAAACTFEFQLPDELIRLAGQGECLLSPDEKVSISIKISPRAKPLVRLSRQRHHFTISVAAPQGGQMPRSVLGELALKPLVVPGMMLLIAIAVVVLGAAIIKPIVEYVPAEVPLLVGNPSNSSDNFELLPLIEPSEANPTSVPVEAEKLLTYEEMFQEIGTQYNINWRLLEAVAYRESRMDYLAIGQASDMGLMQVIPSTWNEWAPKVNVIDPFDPYGNIQVGAAYLAFVRDFCFERGYIHPRWMLVAYNWGPNRLSRFWEDGGTWDDLPATQRNYATTILDMAAQRALNPAVFDQIYAGLDK